MAGVPMEVTISGVTCDLNHRPSGATVQTVPPADIGGSGTGFSPTDLVAAALCGCALTTMALVARREGLSWGDARASVEKEMSSAPRRIGALAVVFHMPRAVAHGHRERLEQAARSCPVAKSLHPDVNVSIQFRYAE